MNIILFTILILLIPFISTTLGSGIVFFFKKEKMNEEVEKICNVFA